MLTAVLWSVVCLFAVGLVLASLRRRAPASRIVLDFLLLTLWLIVGLLVVFDADSNGTVLLAAGAVAGCYVVLTIAVRVGLLE